jgi:hypothetical protein
MFTFNPAAVEIQQLEMLRGAKFAVQEGDATEGRTIYVSPEMYDQIKNADEAQLEYLLKNIPIRRIPVLKQFSFPSPFEGVSHG